MPLIKAQCKSDCSKIKRLWVLMTVYLRRRQSLCSLMLPRCFNVTKGQMSDDFLHILVIEHCCKGGFVCKEIKIILKIQPIVQNLQEIGLHVNKKTSLLEENQIQVKILECIQGKSYKRGII